MTKTLDELIAAFIEFRNNGSVSPDEKGKLPVVICTTQGGSLQFQIRDNPLELNYSEIILWGEIGA